MTNLAGKRAVVTGGSRGIGQATAITLALAGADVASFHLPGDRQSAAETEAGICSAGRRARMVEGDVSEWKQVEDFAQSVADEWGGIDIWVNNASRVFVKPFLEMRSEEWHSLLGSNLHGYYHGCKAALSHMAPKGYGHIVNVSSVTDIQPISNMSAYVAAKGAVVALTKALAIEFAPKGIVINAVAPGAIETQLNVDLYTPAVRQAYCERISVGRLGLPQDIANAILFLSSELSSYMCGHEMVVDGGLVLNGNVGFPSSSNDRPPLPGPVGMLV